MSWSSPHQTMRTWTAALAVALIYFVTGRLGVLLAIPPGLASPVWLPSGVAVVAALLWGSRVWSGIWLGSFAVNVLTLFDTSNVSAAAASLGVVSAVATGSTLQALLAAALTRRWTGSPQPFDKVRNVLLFMAAAMLSCVVAPTFAIVALALDGLAPARYYLNWLTWWLGDLVGILAVTPLLLPLPRPGTSCGSPPRIPLNLRRVAEAGLFLMCLVVAGQIVFGPWFSLSEVDRPFPHLLIPLFVWAALRFGRRAVVLTAIVMTAVAIGAIVHGAGPFGAAQRDATLLWLQTFMGMVIGAGLVLAAAFSECQLAQAHQQVRARELEATLEAVPAVVWIAHDTQCQRITGSRASYEFLRLPYQANASLGVPDTQRPQHFRVLSSGVGLRPGELPVRLAAQGRELRDIETTVFFEDGTQRYLLGSAVPLRNTDGQPCGAVAAFIDITERKRMEELTRARDAAEAASRQKDDFIAMVSHELRTPLTPVMASIGLLERNPALTAEMRQSIEMVRRNVELEAQLIGDLLDISRIARGKIMLEPHPLDLRLVVERAIEICRNDLDATQLDLRVDLDAAAGCTINGDATRLQQVFWNLLRNAIKFTPSGGWIAIRSRPDGPEHVVVEVQDSGVGIEAEALERIFGAFEQASRSVLCQFGGLGLGLAISKTLVELHGGSITAFSSGKGQGATFRVRLPLLRCSAAAGVGVTPTY